VILRGGRVDVGAGMRLQNPFDPFCMIYCFSNADYLHERLNRPDVPAQFEGSDADFFAWKDVLTASGATVFAKRLASLNQDETQARQRTRRAKESGVAIPPRWFSILK